MKEREKREKDKAEKDTKAKKELDTKLKRTETFKEKVKQKYSGVQSTYSRQVLSANNEMIERERDRVNEFKNKYGSYRQKPSSTTLLNTSNEPAKASQVIKNQRQDQEIGN